MNNEHVLRYWMHMQMESDKLEDQLFFWNTFCDEFFGIKSTEEVMAML